MSLAFVLLHYFLDPRMILCILGDRNGLLSARNTLQSVSGAIGMMLPTPSTPVLQLLPCRIMVQLSTMPL
jgi:hypothetical protein